MADLSDVETAVVAAVVAATWQVGASVTGKPVRVFRGWPETENLTARIKAGATLVSVFSPPNMTRQTTRYGRTAAVVAEPPCTLAAHATPAGAATAVAFSGTPAAGQLAGVSFGPQAFAYAVQAGDTLPAIAAALAAQVPGATSAGPVLTLPTALPVIARAMMGATVQTENRRQEQGVMVSVWAPTPQDRDTVASAIDASLAGVDFLSLADGSAAWIRGRSTGSSDASTNADLYRRDLTYGVEYATTATASVPRMLFGVYTTAAGGGPASTTIA